MGGLLATIKHDVLLLVSTTELYIKFVLPESIRLTGVTALFSNIFKI